MAEQVRGTAGLLADEAVAHAYAAAASVPDPEIPCVTVADLGILRSVEMVDGVAVARLTPTYSGCPAVTFIELAVEAALREAGFEPRIERVMSPAWTTDWMSERGREALKAYGIAPPVQRAVDVSGILRRDEPPVPCPQCDSANTRLISRFGSTSCKALYRCRACREPFEYFKPI